MHSVAGTTALEISRPEVIPLSSITFFVLSGGFSGVWTVCNFYIAIALLSTCTFLYTPRMKQRRVIVYISILLYPINIFFPEIFLVCENLEKLDSWFSPHSEKF